jgi:hypothetical protein
MEHLGQPRFLDLTQAIHHLRARGQTKVADGRDRHRQQTHHQQPAHDCDNDAAESFEN